MTQGQSDENVAGGLARLWEHRTSLNNDFNNFANFFLIAESILLAVVGGLIGKPGSTKTIAFALIVLGFVLTFIWLYVQGKQRRVLGLIKAQCEHHFPEYRLVRAERRHPIWKLSNTWLLAYVVPSLFAVTWVVIFLAVRQAAIPVSP